MRLWRDELVNLARSNRLLYFRHTRSSTLEIVVDQDGGITRVVDRLLSGGSWRFFVPPESEQLALDADDQPARLESDQLLTHRADRRGVLNALRALDRRATQEFMDKGLWVLHLGVGMLTWVDPDSQEVAESPLVLVPVELRRESVRESYGLFRTEDDLVVNPALSLKLREFGIELPSIDDVGDLGVDWLLEFVDEAARQREGWKVQNRLVLSPFSFHKDVMYRDLLDNEREVTDHALVQALVLGPREGSALDFDLIPEEELDEKASPERTATILDADASQRQCIAAAEAGRSFVLDGPPGTGKSQTIANIIAQLLLMGRSILFVSEKAAALEVVQKRLKEASLDDYVLEIHSHKASRKQVAKQLGSALAAHPQATAGMSDVQLRELSTRRRQLNERAAALNEVRQPLGRSLHNAIGRVAQIQSCPRAPLPKEIDRTLDSAQFSDILSAARELSRAWGPVARKSAFVWNGVREPRYDSDLGRRIQNQLDGALQAIAHVVARAGGISDEFLLPPPKTFSDADRLQTLLKSVAGRRDVPVKWLLMDDFQCVAIRVRELRVLAEKYAAHETRLAEMAGPNWHDADASWRSSLNDVRQEVAEAEYSWLLPEDATALDCATQIDRLHVAARILQGILDDARRIADCFGLPSQYFTLKHAADLSELGALSVSGEKPEPEWFNPGVSSRVRMAISALRMLVDETREIREDLMQTFTVSALELDLDALAARFASVHKGLRKLGHAYREDKAALAACTLSGRVDKEIVARLPAAVEWKAAETRLSAAEGQFAGVLGSYYRRMETDFEAAGRALRSAERAVSLAGPDAGLDALRAQLGRASVPDAGLQARSERIQSALEEWEERAAEFSDIRADIAVSDDISTAIQRCLDGAVQVQRAQQVLQRILQACGVEMSVVEAQAFLEHREQASSIEASVRDSFATDQELLGAAYRGLGSAWDSLQLDVEWARGIREFVGEELTPEVANRLLDGARHGDSGDLVRAISGWATERDGVIGLFEDARANEIRADLGHSVADAEELLRVLRDSVADIDEWVDYARARGLLLELGLGCVVDYCAEHGVPADDVPLVAERACLERWIDDLFESEKDRLGHLRASQLIPIASEFRELDRALVRHAASKVIAACNARRPRAMIGDVRVIKREAEKQKKHMPVRRLLEQTGEVAQALKPCFMMSPLTVSQFLPPSLRFDYVIFDEASQVRPSDAVNCVYRGRHLIVAGDEMQLPPTSFFEVAANDGDEEWEEEQFDEFDSILHQCKANSGFRELPLRWHYRSQHESLITYSNHAFYAARKRPLITFPSAVQARDDLGVKFFLVEDGVYRRGTSRDNPVEAAQVVERVLHWARQATERGVGLTLGVVAFSEAQATAIEAELERRRRDLPELDDYFNEDRLDGFFVKNLENVQGDERDIMVFSVGYGRDEVGKFTLNFGPLNREGGKRRLNVAISRSRRRVEVISSVDPADFPAEIKAEGVRHLQRYLDYAKRGTEALAMELGPSGLDVESPFEDEVLRTVRSWGYDCQPQVGVAEYRVDIGVRHPSHPGEFALGIECDGAMYHSSRVARDRDRLRQEVLERLGWRIHRIWGTSWYRNRNEQEEQLRKAVEDALTTGPRAPMRGPRPQPAPLVAVPVDECPAWARIYKPAEPRVPDALRGYEMWDDAVRYQLQDMILLVVAEEGPVSDDLLLKRIREAWGYARAGSRTREALTSAVESMLRGGELRRERRGFLLTRDGRLDRARLPSSAGGGTHRDVADVAPFELELAVLALTNDASKVSRDELTKEMARLFGWNRRGAAVAAALDHAVDRLLQMGYLNEEDQLLMLPVDRGADR